MNNFYLFIYLLCIIILNCFWHTHELPRREGFNVGKIKKDINKVTGFVKNFNPVKVIDVGLGKIIDSILGSIPILKIISKKVKKKKGLIDKIKTVFLELFILLLHSIFTPAAGLFTLFLGHQLILFIISNTHVLISPTSILAGI